MKCPTCDSEVADPAKAVKIKVHEASRYRAELTEAYCKTYMEQTGLRADQIQIVEKFVPGTHRIKWFLEPKTEN